MAGLYKLKKLASKHLMDYAISKIRKKVQPQPITTTDIPDQIKKLATLKEEGILSEQEFVSKKQDLLSRM